MTTEVKTEYPHHRKQLKCSFKQIDDCFDDYMKDALRNLSNEGVALYLEGASRVCMIGRGWEPVSIYLEEMPQMVKRLGDETILEMVSHTRLGYVTLTKW